MKANLLLSLLFTCTLNFCCAQWAQQSSPTTANLKAISFYNNRIGFAVGDKGTVIKTMNGGQTWELIKFPVSDNLTSVVLLDSGIVIVTTGSGIAASAVYRSSNAGKTWQRVLTDTRTFYAAKTPAQRLFSISDHIFESFNTGRNWLDHRDLNNTSTYNYLGFTDEQYGMVAGNISGIVTYSAEFVRTADSGKTWYNSFPYDFPNANGFSTMDFVNADTAFMFTNYYKGYGPGDSCQLIMLTNFRLRRDLVDSEWHFKSTIINNSFPDKLYASKFFGSGIAYTSGEKGTIYRSSNHGRRWTKDYTGKAPLNSFYMMNENSGYAVGNGGLVLKRDTVSKNIYVKNMLAVKAYPNPATDKATLDFSIDKQLKILVQLVDERGNIVLTQPAKTFEKGRQQVGLNIAGLHRGLYQVNLVAGGKVIGNASLLIVL
jgi:photosystem II stability/assembly factor-like uncharacterized protein